VPRARLAPARARAAAGRENVTLARRAKVTNVLREDGRVAGVGFVLDGVRREARCDLLVLADGRVSRNADRLGAVPYLSTPSPWSAFVGYCDGLGLPADHGYYSRQPGTMLVVLPCGPSQWCVSASIHNERISRAAVAPVQVFDQVARTDPLVGGTLSRGCPMSPIGGAGKLRMLRRPMAGPGWALVGDCGYFLDPLTALGTRAALVTVRLLRDRVADAGNVLAPRLHAGLTRDRDSLLAPEWDRTVATIAAYGVPPGQLERARTQAADPGAAMAAVRSQMGLRPPTPWPASGGTNSERKAPAWIRSTTSGPSGAA
jgi:flavin-dependent dehydrogenase